MFLIELIFTVSNLGMCGGLERTDCLQFSIYRGCGGNERTDSSHFPYQQGMVVLKELNFYNFSVGKMWWS